MTMNPKLLSHILSLASKKAKKSPAVAETLDTISLTLQDEEFQRIIFSIKDTYGEFYKITVEKELIPTGCQI
jgi:hypothetical protein